MTAPWGLAGGDKGTLSTKRIERGGEVIELRALSTTPAKKGDRLIVETSGGGGYGDPALRSELHRRHDEENGLVTAINGRGERIRTSGPCLPKAVLYQAELHPDVEIE